MCKMMQINRTSYVFNLFLILNQPMKSKCCKKEGRGERPKRKEVQLCGGSQIKEMIGRPTSW